MVYNIRRFLCFVVEAGDDLGKLETCVMLDEVDGKRSDSFRVGHGVFWGMCESERVLR